MTRPVIGDPVAGVGNVSWDGVIIGVTQNYYCQEFGRVNWRGCTAGPIPPISPMNYPIDLFQWNPHKGIWTITISVEELPVGSDTIKSKIEKAKEKIRKQQDADTDDSLSGFLVVCDSSKDRVLRFLEEWTAWYDDLNREDDESN